MVLSARALIYCLLLAASLAAPSSRAAPPPDTLVMAKHLGDVISLDPSEVFELTGGEIIANMYDRLMMYQPERLTELTGGVAESWTILEHGKTITFNIRPDLRFHSGNPVRPEDVAFSLRRVVKLNKTPAFILAQFGWTPDNVDELIEVVGSRQVRLRIATELSPQLVLNVLSAGVGSVVDARLVRAHERDGDLGHHWLKSHSAGSGPFALASWKANEAIILTAFPDYRLGPPGTRRVIVRHIPEPSAQRLLLEKGDVDIARNLTPDQIQGLDPESDIEVDRNPKGTLLYLAANAGHPVLGKPEVQQALRYLVDYEGMANSFLAGQYRVHQAFWPAGLWAALLDQPFRLDLDKAKALLAAAEIDPGVTLTLDTLNDAPFPQIAQSIQATLAQAGIRARILTADGKSLWPKYRARRHELILARWSPDYIDPHANADAFAHNPDNRLEAKLTGVLAWRNAWADTEVNALTLEARNTLDRDARKTLYLDLQRRLQQNSPFVILFQETEQVARRSDVRGFVSGSNFDLVFYRTVTK